MFVHCLRCWIFLKVSKSHLQLPRWMAARESGKVVSGGQSHCTWNGRKGCQLLTGWLGWYLDLRLWLGRCLWVV